jgi:hypothetical protein
LQRDQAPTGGKNKENKGEGHARRFHRASADEKQFLADTSARLLLGLPGKQPEEVGEAIGKLAQFRAHGAAVGRKGVEPAFGPSRGDPGGIEGRAQGGRTRRGPAVK